VEPDLEQIYADEMRERVAKLRAAMIACESGDLQARAAALYDAHLQAHTIKGTSQQLGKKEAAALGTAMSSSLERAREAGELPTSTRDHVDRGCAALLAWLRDTSATRPLVIATAAFALEEPAR
jgi:chemotaxis protein histidine kinase CheA